MPELSEIKRYEISTPYGPMSGPVVVGTLRGKRAAFIARHGEDHTLPPSEVPYRANIYALKQMGVRFVISVNACGSLRPEIAPGHFVIPDQLFDQTKLYRGRTFFERGLVAHIAVPEPFCDYLAPLLAEAAAQSGARVHQGGVFLTIEGPRFSTRGESLIYKNLGCSIVGMTSSPEAYLAREAEISYAAMAYVTDYDSWRTEAEGVTVANLGETMKRSARYAQAAVAYAVAALDEDHTTPGHTALDHAILTDRAAIPPDILEGLRPILARRFQLA
jgi:5'-methylthioadenosine phosphorylase